MIAETNNEGGVATAEKPKVDANTQNVPVTDKKATPVTTEHFNEELQVPAVVAKFASEFHGKIISFKEYSSEKFFAVVTDQGAKYKIGFDGEKILWPTFGDKSNTEPTKK